MRNVMIAPLLLAAFMSLTSMRQGDAFALQGWGTFGVVWGLGIVSAAIWDVADARRG
jgi:hypothetical protein